MNTQSSGSMMLNGIEVRFMTPENLIIKKGLKYVDTFNVMPLIERLSFNPATRKWDPQNILMSGHKGNGKSLLFAAFAEKNDIPYLALDCSEETKERHIKGGFVVTNGSTPFVLGTVPNAILVANQVGIAMLVLEEINALSPQRQKELNPLLDFRKKIEIPELGARFELHPDARLFVVGTMNPSVYGGTYELNEDLKSRFLELEMPYPPPGAEKFLLKEMAPPGAVFSDEVLDQLISFAQQTRQEATGYALSPRDLVQILHSVVRVGWEDALFLACQKFSEEDRTLILDRIRDITQIQVYRDLSKRALVPGLNQ